ncbi:hypothetical protein [Nocardia huaxiensis]|uniref:Uncharacterized protein n=1 Tax=Nocardia huaxiensis TaxID=2755382 RepID=A0A7D6Z0B3_9NOCA|nr:hypothetical protein [Nocardia huaxiensis]QLY29286.1 hypothetical protein H0264_28990 [Nocardia huaxiensis]UFS97239.1 hypothetical protein LPY97_04750 [Nocardia huaxiensis]
MGIAKSHLQSTAAEFAARLKSRSDISSWMQDEYYRHLKLTGTAHKNLASASFDEVWPDVEKILTNLTTGNYERRFTLDGQAIQLNISVLESEDLNGFFCGEYLLRPEEEAKIAEIRNSLKKPSDRRSVYLYRFGDGIERNLAAAVKSGDMAAPEMEPAAFAARFLDSVVALNDAHRKLGKYQIWEHVPISDAQLRDAGLDPIALRAIASRQRLTALPKDDYGKPTYAGQSTLYTPYAL